MNGIDWIKSLTSTDIEPVSVWEIDYNGTKEVRRAKLLTGLEVGSKVFLGIFEPDKEYLKDVGGVYALKTSSMKISALGVVEKITSRTIWVKIGKFGSKEFPSKTLVKVPYTKVGKAVKGSRADI